MKGKKYLVKNIGFLTISQFSTKLLSFFLVPLYTYVLSTAEYGTFDLYVTTVSLFVPILTLNIADSLLRFPLDKDCKIEEVVVIGKKYFILGVIIAAAMVVFNKIFDIYSFLNEYSFLFFLMFLSTALNDILIYLSRGLDKIKQTAISGIISSVAIILLNIVFLLNMHLGLKGYFLATIIGGLIQSTFLLFSTPIWKLLKLNSVNKQLEAEMIQYAKPLLINNISWWVSSASDRYIVTWLRGIAENGIYSVGYKIPSILNIFQTIFGQAWTLSAVKEFDPEDKNGFFTDMYNSYNFCMTFVCSILIIFAKIIARVLYSKDFFTAWKYVPFLLIAIVFGALSGYIGGIFAAVKDTKVFARTSIFGAVVNIILNVVLVQRIGAIGAAISTAVCYFIIWVMRIISVRKYISMRLDLKRDMVSYFILVLQAIILLFIEKTVVLYLVEFALLIILVLLFLAQIKFIVKTMKRKLGR